MFGKCKSLKTKYKMKPRFFRKELGSMVIDELSCILVMGFMFAMIFAYTGYSKMVQTRLAIDNVAKEYLYQMEQVGYLSSEMEHLMAEDLALIGVDKNTIDFSRTSHKETNQAAYGDIVTLNCVVTFDNPLYSMLSVEKKSNGREYTLDNNGNPTNPEGTMFTVAGLNPKITYTVNMSATAKW